MNNKKKIVMTCHGCGVVTWYRDNGTSVPFTDAHRALSKKCVCGDEE
tara:strand:+ start:329 stop:469 length:141 start_codon:yes stop_codon:yes gene_type:complete